VRVKTAHPQPPGVTPEGGPPFDALVQSLRKPQAERDETLQHPHTVFQILKRHYSRYTPEMVEQATGCPKDIFIRVAETILANSGRDRTTAWCYAVGWTQHTRLLDLLRRVPSSSPEPRCPEGASAARL
jgi:formate dehydrogenase major subunit